MIGGTMNKRIAVVAAFTLAFFPSAHTNAQDEVLTVIYLGAKDCRPCQEFDRYEKAAFRQKVADKGMSFREFKVDSLRYIRQANAWPADLRWLRESLISESGAPWFFTVQGQSLVSETQYYSTIIGEDSEIALSTHSSSAATKTTTQSILTKLSAILGLAFH
jgi:hypothetical protein